MKQMLTTLLAMLLMLSAAPGLAQERTGADITYARAVDMAVYLRELATGDYLTIKQVPEALQTFARDWTRGIGESPRMVVQLDVEGFSQVAEMRALFALEEEVVSMEAQSNVVVDVVQTLLYTAAQEAGVSGAGYEQIVQVNDLLNAEMMYAQEGRAGYGLYILLYEDAAPVLLLVSAENDAVSIQGMLLPSVKLARCQNYGQVSLWMLLSGVPMPCQELLPE